MPRKVFVAGEILTAADVNTNLMDQSVMVFDDATARTTAIPTPVEGMVTYLKDTDEVDKFDGSAFVPVGIAPAILQFAKVQDSTNRTTNSETFVDASLEINFTPQASDSTLIVEWSAQANSQVTSGTNGQRFMLARILDGSNALGVQMLGRNLIAQNTVAAASFTPIHYRAALTSGSVSVRTFTCQFRSAQTNMSAVLSNANFSGTLSITEYAGS